jgi:hypothetical protein
MGNGRRWRKSWESDDLHRNIGKLRLEHCDHRSTQGHTWKFFQIKLGGLSKIRDRLIDGLSLAHGSDFRALRNVEVAFFMQDSGERRDRHWVSGLILPLAVLVGN